MIGVIILCRYNSNRLPGKILKEIEGKVILKYIYERLQLIKNQVKIVVATSELESDNKIEKFCISNSIPCFRGDLADVSKRFLDCAEYFNFKSTIRINGDNIFTDSKLIDQMIHHFRSSNLNFLSNVKGRTWPKGISVEIIRTSFYKSFINQFTDSDREHVMTFFYKKNFDNVRFVKNPIKINSNINLAIDTIEDLKIAESILKSMKNDHTSYSYIQILKKYQKIVYEK